MIEFTENMCVHLISKKNWVYKPQCGKVVKNTITLFYGNINIFSVKSTFLLDKEVTQNLVSRKFFKRDHVLLYFSTLFVHTILTSLSISRKICRKIIWTDRLLLFHGKNYVLCTNCGNYRNLLSISPKKYFVKSTI